MSIVDLIPIPKSQSDWNYFAFANAAHHRDITRVIFQTRGISTDDFLLDPIDFRQLDNWLYLHQLLHQQQRTALGIQGYDLQQLDPNDEENLLSWINAHADEHTRMGQILNLG